MIRLSELTIRNVPYATDDEAVLGSRRSVAALVIRAVEDGWSPWVVATGECRISVPRPHFAGDDYSKCMAEACLASIWCYALPKVKPGRAVRYFPWLKFTHPGTTEVGAVQLIFNDGEDIIFDAAGPVGWADILIAHQNRVRAGGLKQ